MHAENDDKDGTIRGLAEGPCFYSINFQWFVFFACLQFAGRVSDPKRRVGCFGVSQIERLLGKPRGKRKRRISMLEETCFRWMAWKDLG